MAARIRVHIRSFNIRVRGVAHGDHSRHGRSHSRPQTIIQRSRSYSGSRSPLIIVGSHRGDHSRQDSRQPTVYLEEGDRPSRGHSRSPTRVLVRGRPLDIPAPQYPLFGGVLVRELPERAIITPRSSSRASRSSRRSEPDRGSSGRHTRPPSIYPGDPEYPDPHSAHSRPPLIFGDPDYIDQRPISAPPHRPHSHAGSHGSPIDEDFAEAPDSPRHPRRPNRVSSRAPSRVSYVPPSRASPVHVVVPTSHRTTPPFTEGNVPRDRVQHPTDKSCFSNTPEDRASRASHYVPEGQPTRYMSEEDAPAPTIVTVRRDSSRSRTPGAHTPGTRPPSHAQATAIPSGSQPSDIHVRSPDYDEADGGSRRPSRAPTEIHPDHPEYDDGSGRQPSRASTAIPLDHSGYDGGSRRPRRALRNSAGTHSHDLLIPEKRYGELYEHGDNRRQTFEQNEEERKAKAEAALAELLHASRPMTPPSRPVTRSAHDVRLLPVEIFGDELEQIIVHGGETPPFIPLGSPSVAGSVAPSRHSVVPSRPTSRIAPSEGSVTVVSGRGPISEADREELSQAAEDARKEVAYYAEQESEAAASEAEQECQEEALRAESERAALSEKAGSERLSSVASIAETIISERSPGSVEKDRMRQLEEEVVQTREMQEAERNELDNDLRAQLEEITNLLHEKKAECEQLKALNDERYAEKQERRGKKDSDVDVLKEMVQQLIAQNDAIRNEVVEHRVSLEGKPAEARAFLVIAVTFTANQQIPFNVQKYLDDFSKALSDEVKMLLAEVVNPREEKLNFRWVLRSATLSKRSVWQPEL
ncbi:hypothetical protein M422DRAFT_257939 [Sphaerobolus stellatus SS14]|uniref:Uncharacterized protein n=1 Tax=Sphaerobolus stellatus (strain SS14) TaxID=990650 RepID=A0A0C9VCW7_SPHS4|nr:hypothetical protein M422DRAFT_257939 [Sphaerobolus stellatus SS14]